MTIEIKVPQLPESVTDATLVNWHRSPGDPVQRDEKLVELETDKVVLEVPCPSDGILREVRVADGATVTAGEVLALLEPGEVSGATAEPEGEPGQVSGASAKPDGKSGAASGASAEPGEFSGASAEPVGVPGTSDPAASEAEALAAPKVAAISEPAPAAADSETLERAGPAVRRLMREHRVDSSAIRGTGRGGRITKSDVLDYIGANTDTTGRPAFDARAQAQEVPDARGAPSEPEAQGTPDTLRTPDSQRTPDSRGAPGAPAKSSSPGTLGAPAKPSSPGTPSAPVTPSARGTPGAPAAPSTSSAPVAPAAPAGHRAERRVPMTRLRARIAERLVEAQHTAAMLTTFNEVDMSAVMAARSRYGELFQRRHGVKLGFMSFFIKACIEGLRRFPALNASVDGSDIIYHDYYDIGVAVSTDRGLVVPILRNAERMTYAEIEQSIVDFGTRARSGALGMQDLTGGTFTLTNGGIFGSMMSTPIINPPQSGILGMHSIQQRPVAVDGEIEVRPMMYLAMTYDHRIVDGREAVQFLVAIKDVLEDPARLLLQV